MSIRTASAAGKLFLTKQTFGGRDLLVQFMGVSDRISHAARVRFCESKVVDTAMFSETFIPLYSLIEVDQEAAKVIWLIQTGEEL